MDSSLGRTRQKAWESPRSDANASSKDQSETPSLVSRLQAGEEAAEEELYALMTRTLAPALTRSLGTEHVTDKLHDIFLVVFRAIRAGHLRDEQQLVPYIFGVARRQAADAIKVFVKDRKRHTGAEAPENCVDERWHPERRLEQSERMRMMTVLMNELQPRQREILDRFYLEAQSHQQICEEMKLSPTQFRLAKSRAKATLTRIRAQRAATGR
jgi:RNA polymerase sigma-70 factor, ECF subfamily